MLVTRENMCCRRGTFHTVILLPPVVFSSIIFPTIADISIAIQVIAINMVSTFFVIAIICIAFFLRYSIEKYSLIKDPFLCKFEYSQCPQGNFFTIYPILSYSACILFYRAFILSQCTLILSGLPFNSNSFSVYPFVLIVSWNLHTSFTEAK